MHLTSAKTMISAFFDTSVLYAALLSSHGASRVLLLAAFRGDLILYISTMVLLEAERNILKKAPQIADAFQVLRERVAGQLVDPTEELIERAAQIVAAKDAPIVAAATRAGAHYLVTLDEKHLIAQREAIKAEFGVDTIRPGELLAVLRSDTAKKPRAD